MLAPPYGFKSINQPSTSPSDPPPHHDATHTQVEVLEVRNAPGQGQGEPLYVQLQLGEHRLRANVKGKSERPEAVVFTQKRLADLYKETLVFTLVNKETRATLGGGALPVRKLMIGRKFDHFFALQPVGPEATTGGRVRVCVRPFGDFDEGFVTTRMLPVYVYSPVPIHRPTHPHKQPLPEVRLSLELMGPLRREFRFLSDVVAKYYSTVDRAVDGAVHAVRGVALMRLLVVALGGLEGGVWGFGS